MANYDSTESINISSAVVETVIGADTKFKGNVNTDKPIRIDGYFEGEIVSTDLVVITETGTFNGKLKCKDLQLLGHCEGSIDCEDTFQITSGASVIGDFVAAHFLTQKDCTIEGKCTIKPQK